MIRRGLLPALLACLSLGACATPGETQAGWRLQNDIEKLINMNEFAHGYILSFGSRVVDTKVVSVDGNVITEHWFVKRGDRQVMYVVKMTPSPRGGTNFTVTLPKEDQKA